MTLLEHIREGNMKGSGALLSPAPTQNEKNGGNSGHAPEDRYAPEHGTGVEAGRDTRGAAVPEESRGKIPEPPPSPRKHGERPCSKCHGDKRVCLCASDGGVPFDP